MRVVLSAANPGAAFLIRTTLDVLVRSPGVQVAGVLLQPPADTILSQHCAELGVPCRRLGAPRFFSGDDTACKALLECLEELVMPFAPDAVVTGLSGPDLGVDEGLVHLARAKGWLAYSLQDAPGWVVPGLTDPAPTYFVQSSAHVDQTESMRGVHRAISAGALKLLSYSDAAKERAACAMPRRGVSFLGQPLWHLAGYESALTGLAQALDQAGMGPLVYRPHPLEDTDKLSRLVSSKLLREESNVSYEETLMSRDVLASCFSTGLQDAAQLASLTSRACPQLLFCLDQDDIRDAFVSAGQPLQQTIDKQPWAQFLQTPPTAAVLRDVLQPGAAHAPGFETPVPDRIVQTILNDWIATRFLPQTYAADTDLTGTRTGKDQSRADSSDAIPGLAAVLDGLGSRLAPLRQVIPSQGGNHYLRTDLEGHGAVFLKTIHANQAARLGNAMLFEAAVARHCPHVAAPLLSSPVALEGSDNCVALWPWLDASPIDVSDPHELHAAGIALGSLHQELRRSDFPATYAQDRVAWMLQSWQDLHRDAENNQLGSFHRRFPWLKVALKEVSRGISERFLSSPRQLVHGDLNPGNLMCMPGPLVMFIDFEEAVQSFLPSFFDLATMIERHLMTGTVHTEWQDGAATILEAYIAQTGTRLPYEGCFFDARCFSILRSLTILVVSERVGRPWPDSEWHKFDKLTRFVLEQEQDLSAFVKAFT